MTSILCSASRLFFVFFILLIACSENVAHAQGYFFWNPADARVAFASEINPALVTRHDSQISAGLKVFHYGFLEESSFGIRENRINMSFPYLLPGELALGFDIRYFSAQIYAELFTALMVSRELASRFSIGVKVALERRSFDSGQFQGVDFSDPVLNGGLSATRLNLGLGLYFAPGRFTLGLGLDHLNQAGIGRFDAGARLPVEVSASLGVNFGALTPSLLLHHDGQSLRTGIAIAAHRGGLGTLRLGYEQQLPFRIEASLNLSRDATLAYGIDAPGSGTRGLSAGSHQLIYTHILGRAPELQQPEILFSTRKLQIIEKTVWRSMPADLRIEDLSAIDEIVPGYLSTAHSTADLMIVVAGPLSQHETPAGARERHRRLAAKIQAAAQSNPGLQIVIRADAQTLDDARRLRAAILRSAPEIAGQLRIARLAGAGTHQIDGFVPGKVTIARYDPQLSAGHVELMLRVPGKTRKTRGWELVIQNTDGQPVRRFAGNGNLPHKVTWDWRDGRGTLVPPGEYVCLLQATTIYGNQRVARTEPLRVTLIRRRVKLQFKREPESRTSLPVAAPPTAERNWDGE